MNPERSLEKSNNFGPILFPMGLLLLFISCILVGLYPGIQRAWRLNQGLVVLTQGLAANQPDLIAQGQTILSQVPDENDRLKNLVNGEVDASNLIINGSFEFNGQGWVYGSSGDIMPVWTNAQAHSGIQSLAISFPGEDINFYHMYQTVSVEPVSCYRLSAYSRTENLTDNIGLEVWDAERGYQYWYAGKTLNVAGTVDWTPSHFEFCTAEDVRQIQVRLRRYGGKGQEVSGTVWLDDLYLEKLP